MEMIKDPKLQLQQETEGKNIMRGTKVIQLSSFFSIKVEFKCLM